jgi:uncharacterized protein (TIGR03435 family)
MRAGSGGLERSAKCRTEAASLVRTQFGRGDELAVLLIPRNQTRVPQLYCHNFMKTAFFLLIALTARGQEPVFEVASVKPSQNLREGYTIRNNPGRFETVNTTLASLIQYALPAQDFQILGGPNWIHDARFDIVASNGQPDTDVKNQAERIGRIRARLRHLLEDRFQLQLQAEQREMPVYELGVEKGGIRMKSSDPLGNVDMDHGAAGSTMNGKGMTMPRLADILTGITKRPVKDKTGLSGAYDVELRYSLELAAPNADAPAKDNSMTYPSLFTAMKEQLGLHLTGGKALAPVWVVVRAEKPGEN